MELNDTALLMQSNDYKERFKAEYWQLKIRYERLCAVLNKAWEGCLTFELSCPLDLLGAQKVYMESYLHILEERAEIEGVALDE